MTTIAPFEYDRSFDFEVSADELWATFQRTEQFPEWWRWLRHHDLDGRTGLDEGVEARCVVRGPLPYELRLTISVKEVVPGRLVATEIDGDLRGPARLELGGEGDARSRARLTWSLEVIDPALRAMARVARPLMTWGHDVVVSRGVRQFERYALSA